MGSNHLFNLSDLLIHWELNKKQWPISLWGAPVVGEFKWNVAGAAFGKSGMSTVKNKENFEKL